MPKKDEVMFTTREAPWMQLGTVIEGDVTAAEAAKLANMDFTVSLQPAGHKKPGTRKPGESAWQETPNRRAVVADDTGEVFDFVSRDYTLVQYADAFGFMDTVNPRYIAAGTMRGRKQGFMVVQRPDLAELDLRLDGEHDTHGLYVVLRTSHDRSRGIEVAIMPLRGKCMNQLALQSFTSGIKQRWAVRHTGNDPMTKLTEAQRVFTQLENYAEAYEHQAKTMYQVELTTESAERIINYVLPRRPKRDEQRLAILDVWQHSDRVGFAGTGWGLLNAVSEYMEWGRQSTLRTPQSRFLGGLDGATHRALDITQQLILREAE